MRIIFRSARKRLGAVRATRKEKEKQPREVNGETHKAAALAAEVGQKRGRLLGLRDLAGRGGRSRGSVRAESA